MAPSGCFTVYGAEFRDRTPSPRAHNCQGAFLLLPALSVDVTGDISM